MSKKLLTPWFPASVKPAHKGVYPTAFGVAFTGYTYWSGAGWANQCCTPEAAWRDRQFTGGATQNKRWRGLASDPKGKA